MKRHSSWLALGLFLFVVLACNVGKKSNSVENLHMAKDNGKGDPGDETNVFSTGDRTIHCVAKLADPKAGTKMKFSWFIVDAEGTENEKIRDIDYTTLALENIVHSHLTLPQDWPSGKYKVEVSVNGNLERTTQYSVR